ncbi:hypothetical protein RF55_12737, partial [Lasius niger]
MEVERETARLGVPSSEQESRLPGLLVCLPALLACPLACLPACQPAKPASQPASHPKFPS